MAKSPCDASNPCKKCWWLLNEKYRRDNMAGRQLLITSISRRGYEGLVWPKWAGPTQQAKESTSSRNDGMFDNHDPNIEPLRGD